MTPKEKARELVEQYKNTVSAYGSEQYCNWLAKKCALIAADEILSFELIPEAAYEVLKYWQEVKKEIELL